MCQKCAEFDIEDAKVMMQAHGYQFLQPNAPVEYAVSWDDRIITVTQVKDRAVAMAAEQAASQPGRWEPKQRSCGPWEEIADESQK